MALACVAPCSPTQEARALTASRYARLRRWLVQQMCRTPECAHRGRQGPRALMASRCTRLCHWLRGSSDSVASSGASGTGAPPASRRSYPGSDPAAPGPAPPCLPPTASPSAAAPGSSSPPGSGKGRGAASPGSSSLEDAAPAASPSPLPAHHPTRTAHAGASGLLWGNPERCSQNSRARRPLCERK